MNKDQKLLAEAYENVKFTQRKKPFLEKPGRLNPTVDLEAIADFLNKHEVYSGAPVKGSGGWYVHNSEVVNDDAEGGHSGISIRIVPEKNGLVFHNKLRDSNNYIKTLISWPVHAKDVEGYMQRRSAELWGDENAESVSNDFIKQIERKAGEYRYFIGEADNGRLYAIIVEYDKYSDGDRWIEEVNYYYQIEGEEEGRYISDEKAKGMLKDISISSPDLVDSNKFIFSYL